MPPSPRILATLCLAAILLSVSFALAGGRQPTTGPDDPFERHRVTSLRELGGLSYELRNETDPARRTELALEITRVRLDLEARGSG